MVGVRLIFYSTRWGYIVVHLYTFQFVYTALAGIKEVKIMLQWYIYQTGTKQVVVLYTKQK